MAMVFGTLDKFPLTWPFSYSPGIVCKTQAILKKEEPLKINLKI